MNEWIDSWIYKRPTVCRGSQVKLHGRNHGDTVNCIQTFGNRERENTSVLEPSIFRLRTGERHYQLYNNYADLMYVLMEVNIVEDSITKN